jgi:hypothetical protein
MKEAIANQRQLDGIIDELRAALQKMIFALPGKSPKTRCGRHPKTT